MLQQRDLLNNIKTKMFWLLDLYFQNDINLERSKKFRKKVFYYDDTCFRIVFLPWKTSMDKAMKYSLIPISWEVLVYEWPLNLVSYIPNEMPEAQKILANDVYNFFSNNKNKFNKKVKILWISQWIYPAFYVANNVIKCDKFIAVTPAWKWEEALWYSKAVKRVCVESNKKWFDFWDYEKILKKSNPINNIKNLPLDIEIYYWRFDRYIRYFLTESFLIELKKNWKTPKVFKNKFLWHFGTIISFWRKLRKWLI